MLDIIGFVILCWAAASLNNYRNNYNDEDEKLRKTILTIVIVLIVITILQAGTMVLGYLGFKRLNINYLKCFSILMMIWIAIDILLFVLSLGGIFYILILPFVLSIISILRANRMRSLLVGNFSFSF